MRHTAIACLVTLLVIVLLGAPAAAASNKYEEKFSRTEPLAADGKLYLSNISGDIHIQTWTRNEVKIDAVKRSTAGSAEKAKENAERVKIEVHREDGRLKIETEYPEDRTMPKRFNVSVDYTLTVPSRAGVTVNTVSGNIVAGDMAGLAKLTTVSGNIGAKRIQNGGVFTVVSGNIDLKETAGDVAVTDVSGSISLSGLSGSVKGETVSGNVIAEHLSAATSVSLTVHSGDIVFGGSLNPNGRYVLSAHSGRISATLPSDAAFDFTCDTFSGRIQSDFKASAEERSDELPHAREMRGTVNGGGADLTITTFSGPIELRKGK